MAKKKNTRTVVIAVVIALAVLAAAVGVGWIVGSGSRDDADTSTASQGASGGADEDEAESSGGESVCGLPEGSQEVPAEGPEAEWQILQGHTVPSSSEKFGPGETKGGDRACFAHNPTGALFAVLNTGRVLPKEHLLKHITDGPRREAFEDAPEPSVDPGSRTEVKGFKLEVESRDRVLVRTVYSTDGGSLYEVPSQVVWEDGDWMLDGSEDATSEPAEVDSLDGYVKWGPE